MPDIMKSMDNVNTGSTIFGIPLDLPVLPAPVSNIRRNLKGIFKEDEYNRILLKGSKKAGSIGCISLSEMELRQLKFLPSGIDIKRIAPL